MIEINNIGDVREWSSLLKQPAKPIAKTPKQPRKGRLNPKYKGCYYVVGKKFYNAREAAKAANMPVMTFLRLVRSGKDKDYTFVPDPERIL